MAKATEMVAAAFFYVVVSAVCTYLLSAPGLWLLHRKGALPKFGSWMPMATLLLWWAMFFGYLLAGSPGKRFGNILELAFVMPGLGAFCLVLPIFLGPAVESKTAGRLVFWLIPLASVAAFRALAPPISM
jgi:hypothetical protein